MLESRFSDDLPIVSGDHESRQLYDVRYPETVSAQQGNEVREGLVRLLLHCRRCRTVRANTDLPGKKDKLGRPRHADRVTVRSKGGVDTFRIPASYQYDPFLPA